MAVWNQTEVHKIARYMSHEIHELISFAERLRKMPGKTDGFFQLQKVGKVWIVGRLAKATKKK